MARVNLKDMNNEVLDGVGPLKPPTFGNSSFIPTVQTEKAAISPESRPCTCPVARQKARMAQRGIEGLQRSRSPCRWGEECPAGHPAHGDGFGWPQAGVTMPL